MVLVILWIYFTAPGTGLLSKMDCVLQDNIQLSVWSDALVQMSFSARQWPEAQEHVHLWITQKNYKNWGFRVVCSSTWLEPNWMVFHARKSSSMAELKEFCQKTGPPLFHSVVKKQSKVIGSVWLQQLLLKVAQPVIIFVYFSQLVDMDVSSFCSEIMIQQYCVVYI